MNTLLNKYLELQKKEKFCVSPTNKFPIPTEYSKKQSDNTKSQPTASITLVTVADQLGTVTRGDENHPTGVVKEV